MLKRIKKMNTIITLCCAFCLALAACGESTSDTASSVPTQEMSEIQTSGSEENLFEESSTEESLNTVVGADLIAGEWNCIATYYDDKLILFEKLPDLADLYDQTLTFNVDGTYAIYDVPYGEKGRWFKSNQQVFSDFEHAYLVTKEYTTFGKLEDGEITFTETESTGTAIICLQDENPNNLVWLETDDEDVKIFVYEKDGASDSYSLSSKSGSQDPQSYSTGTLGEQNALERAQSYLNSSAFSYDSLVDQLEYEGFSHSEAVYGADNCGANWNDQALKKALSYLKHSAFSESGLIEQLEYEGFASSQAEYGVSRCGADWDEQATKKAASYLRHSSFSRSDLIDQLEYEGFNYSQAVYGVTQNGY